MRNTTSSEPIALRLANETVIVLTGREAWALRKLIEAGAEGTTPIKTPGPRWSGYVHKLRKAGIDVRTIRESHGGPFPGWHARYVLAGSFEILQPPERTPDWTEAA